MFLGISQLKRSLKWEFYIEVASNKNYSRKRIVENYGKIVID
jgi:hypothetical protein